VRFYQGWFQMLYIDLPLFIASTNSVSAFYITGQRALYPREWRSRVKYIPFLMSVGIGLAITNAKAVIEGAVGIKSAFVRTPKFSVEGKNDNWERKKYHRRIGWIPSVELMMAAYFLFTVVYSLESENYLTSPFLMLFFVGYSYTGAMSLFQTPMRRLWHALPAVIRGRARTVSVET